MSEQVKKTEDDYYEDFKKKNLTWAQDSYDAQAAEQQSISDAYLDGVTEAIKKNKDHAVGKINTQIAELPTLYQAAFDANAVQEEVNKRKAREHMANLGLTDSGLNQMQQTAFMISRQNADYALNQKKAAAVASLQQQIADLENEAAVKEMEAKTQEKARLAGVKSQIKASLWADAETNARAAAKYAYQEDQNREAAIKKAEIDALAKQAEARYKIGDLNANGVLDPDEIETLITKYKLENGEYDDVVAAYTPIQGQDGNTVYLGYTGLEERKAAQDAAVKAQENANKFISSDNYKTAAKIYITQGYSAFQEYAKRFVQGAGWGDDATDEIIIILNQIKQDYGNTFVGDDVEWKMVSDGGWHTGDLDDDAEVNIDGKTYRIDELYAFLTENLGMSSKEAKNWLVPYQSKLGITGQGWFLNPVRKADKYTVSHPLKREQK